MSKKKDLIENQSKFDDPDFYINRESSWVDFNKRVLHQATRKVIPLLERLKFLGISASNIDEFIMVRFSSILNKLNKSEHDIAGLNPEEEYRLILNKIKDFKILQNECYSKLSKKLLKKNIHICNFIELNIKEKEEVEKIFCKNIYPLLTPITYDTTKEFPTLKSKQLNIIVTLQDRLNPNFQVISLIPIENLDRIYKINNEGTKFILLEEIIFNFLHKIFINKKIVYCGCCRILREADIELDHNRDIYIIDRMKQTLIQREFSKSIFIEVNENIPKYILKLLLKILDLEKTHVFKSNNILDLSFWASIPIKNLNYEYKPFIPQYPEELIGEHDMFTAIENNDIILHHPYESFEAVVKFIEHAAEDKQVLAIKQTLYRVSSTDSPIVEALCRASENGKQVSVLLEIKARFDEDRNISLIEKLKLSGCKLIYGVEELKTHCKFSVVVRKTSKGIKIYSHLGTGNYNDKTSKIYTDLSYFTVKDKIGEDLITVFNILSGYSEPTTEINKMYFSPYNLRSRLTECINREIQNVKKGKKGQITFKLNSLSDKDIIKKLYEASEEGVEINIFCRGICSMKPINKNIKIKSVIGRFLEHSRIYYFFNNGKTDLYMSSADLLTRNLDKRVELLIPLTDEEVKIKLLNILGKYFDDRFNTYKMNFEGKYKLLNQDKKEIFDLHKYFMTEAISNFKLQSIPKLSLKAKNKKIKI
jgi:polyphosphate kinase